MNIAQTMPERKGEVGSLRTRGGLGCLLGRHWRRRVGRRSWRVFRSWSRLSLMLAVAVLVGAGLLSRRPERSLALSQLIWAMGHGIVSLLNSHKDFPFVGKKALIEGSIDMIFDGIRA